MTYVTLNPEMMRDDARFAVAVLDNVVGAHPVMACSMYKYYLSRVTCNELMLYRRARLEGEALQVVLRRTPLRYPAGAIPPALLGSERGVIRL